MIRMDYRGAKNYVVKLLGEQLDSKLCYHDLDHTLDVYNASIRLCGLEGITGKKRDLIGIAALLHDAGMTSRYHDHETESARMAREILPGFGYGDKDIAEICDLVLGTRMPQKAETLPGRILCDADLDYLGRDDFLLRSFQLRQEWKILGVMDASVVEWLTFQVSFMESHRFLTPSAMTLRNEGKQRNIVALKRYITTTSTD